MSRKHPPQIPPYIINVHKPDGLSSHDVIRHFKRNLPQGFGKIGHFGTLDPFASGVLLVAVAGASRLNDYVHQFLPKTYLATGILGQRTASGDITTETLEKEGQKELKKKLESFDLDKFQTFLSERFLGRYLQRPPMYSATKHQGKALYKWAREGVDIEKEKVEREIYYLEVVSWDFPKLTFRVRASSGTYIRTLFEDMGESLGTIGTLSDLCRESIGHLTIETALKEENWPKDRLFSWDNQALKLDQVLPANKIYLNERLSTLYRNGQAFALKEAQNIVESSDTQGLCWVYDTDERLIGLGKLNDGQVSAAFNLPQV